MGTRRMHDATRRVFWDASRAPPGPYAHGMGPFKRKGLGFDQRSFVRAHRRGIEDPRGLAFSGRRGTHPYPYSRTPGVGEARGSRNGAVPEGKWRKMGEWGGGREERGTPPPAKFSSRFSARPRFAISALGGPSRIQGPAKSDPRREISMKDGVESSGG